MFENHQKCRIWHFPPISVFWHFGELLSTQNVNVARFARNVEWDFFEIFKHCAVCFRNILITILYFHTGYERRLTGNFYLVKCLSVSRFFCITIQYGILNGKDLVKSKMTQELEKCEKFKICANLHQKDLNCGILSLERDYDEGLQIWQLLNWLVIYLNEIDGWVILTSGHPPEGRIEASEAS